MVVVVLSPLIDDTSSPESPLLAGFSSDEPQTAYVFVDVTPKGWSLLYKFCVENKDKYPGGIHRLRIPFSLSTWSPAEYVLTGAFRKERCVGSLRNVHNIGEYRFERVVLTTEERGTWPWPHEGTLADVKGNAEKADEWMFRVPRLLSGLTMLQEQMVEEYQGRKVHYHREYVLAFMGRYGLVNEFQLVNTGWINNCLPLVIQKEPLLWPRLGEVQEPSTEKTKEWILTKANHPMAKSRELVNKEVFGSVVRVKRVINDLTGEFIDLSGGDVFDYLDRWFEARVEWSKREKLFMMSEEEQEKRIFVRTCVLNQPLQFRGDRIKRFLDYSETGKFEYLAYVFGEEQAHKFFNIPIGKIGRELYALGQSSKPVYTLLLESYGIGTSIDSDRAYVDQIYEQEDDYSSFSGDDDDDGDEKDAPPPKVYREDDEIII